jgi:hypothetical protein
MTPPTREDVDRLTEVTAEALKNVKPSDDMLSQVADAAAYVAERVPPPFSVALGIAAVALKAGSAIAAAGQDPIVEITRMLDRNPHVDKVRGEWASFIDAHWPVGHRKTAPSPSSGPGLDPYDDDGHGR